MKRIALTFIGRDRPGLIAEITQSLFKSGCNVEDTTMTILEGEFAMILIASLPTPTVEKKLRKAFDDCRRKWGLHHFWKVLPTNLVRGEKHPPGSKSFVLSVMGKDRTGIVYETTRILAQKKLNITDLNSKILGTGAKAVFMMVLEVDVPKGFNLKRLDPAWQKLRRQLKVDIQIKPLERLSF